MPKTFRPEITALSPFRRKLLIAHDDPASGPHNSDEFIESAIGLIEQIYPAKVEQPVET